MSTALELKQFLEFYSPKTTPDDFLKKQRLIRTTDSGIYATYAGILLFSENPSAILPKKCAIKITRYMTNEEEPERVHLGKQYTVEGSLMQQINQSLAIIKSVIEEISILTDSGMEKAKYPTDAIKEVLVNAIIHRDYNISDDIQVFIYNNRIEIRSPGRLPGHVTLKNILNERFARNNTIVRILNKFPDPPNKDIGEGLNTAFQKMKEVKLKPPIISEKDSSVIVILPHEYLAQPEEMVLTYLKNNSEITNKIARSLTGIKSENLVKVVFYKLADRNLIERVPEKKGMNSAWRLKKNHTRNP